MQTPSTGAAAPQQAISLPLIVERDTGATSAGELPVIALGAAEARVALESPEDDRPLNPVFEALEQERQPQPEPAAHPRDLLGALLESRNLRLSNCLVEDVAQAAGLANRRLAQILANPESAQAAGTQTARSRLLEHAAHLALRPDASAGLVSAMEGGLAAMPADLQAAWLAEWLSWRQPPAGIQDKAMALIHSGQLSDAARTNLLAKVTVRNLMGSPPPSAAPLHNL